jgi:hypothetical protein
MNITIRDGYNYVPLKVRYVASIAGAALVLSAIVGLTGVLDDTASRGVSARQVLPSVAASSLASESVADYATREAAVLAGLKAAPAEQPVRWLVLDIEAARPD